MTSQPKLKSNKKKSNRDQDRNFENRPEKSFDKYSEKRSSQYSDKRSDNRPDRSSDKSFDKPYKSLERSFDKRSDRADKRSDSKYSGKSNKYTDKYTDRHSEKSFERRADVPEPRFDRQFEKPITKKIGEKFANKKFVDKKSGDKFVDRKFGDRHIGRDSTERFDRGDRNFDRNRKFDLDQNFGDRPSVPNFERRSLPPVGRNFDRDDELAIVPPKQTEANPDIVYGRHAVEAVLNSDRSINRIWVTPRLRYSADFLPLIDEKADKYLWVDAATGSGVLGAVLAQHVHKTDETKIVPTHLDLDDPVHRVIFDKELAYEPATLYIWQGVPVGTITYHTFTNTNGNQCQVDHYGIQSHLTYLK